MAGRPITSAIGLIIAAQWIAAPVIGADYRGMSAGWPNYANGYYAAGYPANYAAGPAYYVARPVATVAYAGQPPAGTLYAPARAAYSNPAYFAAYGRSPVAYQPVSAAGYPPATAGYYAPAAGAYYAPAAPTTAYYAPVTANYAPANSYAVSPAGLSSAGSEAAAYFGQPTPLNYVPPRVAYRTTYAPVPVYMYRPVTAYDPIVGQPVTCMQASTCNTCQPQRSRCVWWNPFTWFSHGSCGSPPPTTAYCGSGCGQPYYPTQPVTPTIPIIPAPATVPQNVIPSMPAFPRTIPASPTIPPPPTGAAVPGATTIPSPRFGDPASVPPSLGPRTIPSSPGGTIISPIPSTTIPSQPGATTPINPGGSFGAPPSSGAPGPGGSFPVNPGTPPSGSFGSPGLGSGTFYAPQVDPYSTTLTPANPAIGNAGRIPPGPSPQVGPAHSVFGSGYSPRGTAADDRAIRAPDLIPALPPSVQTVPDLDAPAAPRPSSTAPQLLDPRDKTARADNRWAVVPAQWPKKEAATRSFTEPPASPTSAHQPQAKDHNAGAAYDDRGWKSAPAF